jgi:hypothetical protein
MCMHGDEDRARVPHPRALQGQLLGGFARHAGALLDRLDVGGVWDVLLADKSRTGLHATTEPGTRDVRKPWLYSPALGTIRLV